MNTQANATSESYFDPQASAPAAISAAQRLYWALRRELWENRSIYIAPLAAAGVALFGFLLTLIHLPEKMRAAAALDPMQQHERIEQPFDAAAALLMGTFLIVGMFYCVEALQRERRDRSILFWKSLPVSDLTTVAAKVSIPFVVLPLLTFAITFATQLIMLLASSAVLAGSGLSVATYWAQVSLLQMSLRAAFLWAVLPPLAICTLEKLLFNTAHFAAFLGQFFTGGTEGLYAPGTMPMDPMTHLTPGKFLSTPGLWIGLAITAAFLAAAVRLRRYRGPM